MYTLEKSCNTKRMKIKITSGQSAATAARYSLKQWHCSVLRFVLNLISLNSCQQSCRNNSEDTNRKLTLSNISESKIGSRVSTKMHSFKNVVPSCFMFTYIELWWRVILWVPQTKLHYKLGILQFLWQQQHGVKLNLLCVHTNACKSHLWTNSNVEERALGEQEETRGWRKESK